MRIETCSKYFVFCSLICLNSLCKGSYTQVYSSLGENSLFCKRLNPQRVKDDSTHFALESKEYICVPVLLKKIYLAHIISTFTGTTNKYATMDV